MKKYPSAATNDQRSESSEPDEPGRLRTFLQEAGDFAIFTGKVMQRSFSVFTEFREFLRQCYATGNRSLGLVCVTGIIMGLVLTIQSRPILSDFGAESMLPDMVSVSLVREIGPVITALICAGKVGSGMGAELGSMRVTEQIDAMEVSAVNPINYLVVTRVAAITFTLPLLVMFADAMGMIGSWIGMNLKGEVNFAVFLAHSFRSLDFMDFFPALIKSFFFGTVIGIVGCYKGYSAGKGTASVGIAANSAVVMSSLLIIIVDLIVVQITDLLV
jgi:phospholipid/cholesterol/gamma-HCH transport system permease protein